MSELNCVDMSRSRGELTAGEGACLKAAGIAKVVVARCSGGCGLIARHQAEAAVAAELRLEAYIYLEFESGPAWWVHEALARLEGPPWPLVARRRGHLTHRRHRRPTLRRLARGRRRHRAV